MKQVNYYELNDYIEKGALLIDIRSYNDFLNYHIPSSIPIDTFKQLPKEKLLIFICESGQKAKDFAYYYHQYGYQCYYLTGGLALYQTMQHSHPYY